MTDVLELGLAGLAGGLLGALLGGALAWRWIGVRLDAWDRSWQDAMQRVPRDPQPSLRLELDALSRRQARRDAEAEERAREHAMALRALIDGLAAPAVARAPTAVSVPAPRPASTTFPARSPEQPCASFAPSLPVRDEPVPSRELSDDEIDALPPELPAAGKARKRILPAPKKPVLHRL